MKNDLQKHKKSDKVKWILTFVGFLIILVMLVGMGLQLFGQNNLKPSEWFKKPNSEQASTNNGAKDGAIINNGNSDCMQVVSSKIVYADYEKNGVSPQADTAYTLSATIKPSAAVDKTIKWSVAWQNGNSEWANDKNVTDYLTINTDTTQSGENITVTCLKDFGEVIEITACSSEDETKKAICTVDYRKRIKSVNYVFQYDGNSMDNVIADSDGVYRFDYKNELKSYTVVPTPVYSAYTIDCTYTSSIVGNFTDTFTDNDIEVNDLSLLAGINQYSKPNVETTKRVVLFYSNVFYYLPSYGHLRNEYANKVSSCYSSYNNVMTVEEKSHPLVIASKNILDKVLSSIGTTSTNIYTTLNSNDEIYNNFCTTIRNYVDNFIYPGCLEPEFSLSRDALDFCYMVSSTLYESDLIGKYKDKVYSCIGKYNNSLTDEDKTCSPVIHCKKALDNALNSINASFEDFKMYDDRLNSDNHGAFLVALRNQIHLYNPAIYNCVYMNKIGFDSLDTFLQNCINCNNENKGIVEYEITYITDGLTYKTKLSLGFTTNTVGAVRGIEIDNGNLVI